MGNQVCTAFGRGGLMTCTNPQMDANPPPRDAGARDAAPSDAAPKDSAPGDTGTVSDGSAASG
jgi:hypothetical protein